MSCVHVTACLQSVTSSLEVEGLSALRIVHGECMHVRFSSHSWTPLKTVVSTSIWAGNLPQRTRRHVAGPPLQSIHLRDVLG